MFCSLIKPGFKSFNDKEIPNHKYYILHDITNIDGQECTGLQLQQSVNELKLYRIRCEALQLRM